MRNRWPSLPKPLAPGAEEDVLELVRQGRRIEAIKRYRKLNPGIGLREAKNVIDGL